jgi:hypothetical protein
MKISDRNFMASQAFYGLSIACQDQLPKLNKYCPSVNDKDWDAALDRLVDLSYRVADRMLAKDKEKDA